MEINSFNIRKRYNHLHGELQDVYHDASKKMGLSDSASLILYTICDAGDFCPLSDIVRLSGLPKQTVNSAIRKLESEDLIYLASSGAKTKNVYLTEQGKQLTDRTVRVLLKLEDEVFAAWPAEDVQQYLALTERFLNAMKVGIEILQKE